MLRCSQLDAGVEANFEAMAPTNKDLQQQDRAFDDVERVVIQKCRGADLRLFGSSAR